MLLLGNMPKACHRLGGPEEEIHKTCQTYCIESPVVSLRTCSSSPPLGLVHEVTLAPNRLTVAVLPLGCVRSTTGRPKPFKSKSTRSRMAKSLRQWSK